MPKSAKPEPKTIKVICSLCDLDWDSHGDNPTTEDCIRLLKIEAAKPKTCGCIHWHWNQVYTWPTITTPTVTTPYYTHLDNVSTSALNTNNASYTISSTGEYINANATSDSYVYKTPEITDGKPECLNPL